MTGQPLQITDLTAIGARPQEPEFSIDATDFAGKATDVPTAQDSDRLAEVGLGCVRAIVLVLSVEAFVGLIVYAVYSFLRTAH